MTVYSKYNVIYRLQKWLDSVPGQTFMNYAYSWGASVVILGTLFKLTHLPGANFMLYLGMGTEVLVFFIAAFDRPFDKSEIDKELATHVVDEDAVPADGSVVAAGGGSAVVGGGIVSGGIIGGGVIGGSAVADGATVVAGDGTGVAGGTIIIGGGSGAAAEVDTEKLSEMEEAQNNYVEELKKLTEMLGKVSDQSERLTRDSEEMENLNRTLTGICKVYEMQLKGASAQIGTIDQINEQSRRMAEQIAELNKIYARMIEAMTVNMPQIK